MAWALGLADAPAGVEHGRLAGSRPCALEEVVQDGNALMPICERVPDDRCEKQAKLFAVSFSNFEQLFNAILVFLLLL